MISKKVNNSEIFIPSLLFFQALASILYKAGAEHAYVNPKKIKKALGVSIETEAELGNYLFLKSEIPSDKFCKPIWADLFQHFTSNVDNSRR